jgi:hypothetical protein
MGVPDKIITIIKIMYENYVCCVSHKGKLSDPFPTGFVSRPALGPTQTPVQWVPRVLSPGVKSCRGVMLTTHPI